jgi:hypothetical protein
MIHSLRPECLAILILFVPWRFTVTNLTALRSGGGGSPNYHYHNLVMEHESSGEIRDRPLSKEKRVISAISE